ncbi:MAG: c-type cytochrome [Bacteroidetes bacterium]|nr:c-type cytochrome [Bacteroidota bacterium]
MPQNNRQVFKLVLYSAGVVIITLIVVVMFRNKLPKEVSSNPSVWPKFDVNALPPDSNGQMIRYGYRLIMETSNIAGPDVQNPKMRFAGNNLECRNCHFNGGQDKNTMSFVGVANRYPAYSKRHERMSDLKERIDDCFERSMNGNKLPAESYELKSILAYMNWLSKGVPKDLEGVTVKDIDFPKREPDKEKGKSLYMVKCITCHGFDGLGVLKNPIIQGGVKYVIPPIAGDDSFNNGAGMSRMERLVKFLKTQMPKDNPGSLSLEEAYDIAGYVSGLKRPEYKGEK